MNKLFDEFEKPNYQEWVEVIKSDLKDKPLELVQRNDEIEEFQFNSYQHQDSVNTSFIPNLNNSFIRNTNGLDNQWENVISIYVQDEAKSNQSAMQAFKLGATALRFIIQKESVNWKSLFQGIKLQHIETTIAITNFEIYQSAQQEISTVYLQHISFELELPTIESNWVELATYLKKSPQFTLIANGYSMQQVGATTWQEVNYAIAVAHEMLVKLMENGLSVDEAAICIHFNVGVGSNYFYEIAKLRSLRILWGRILEQYQAQNSKPYNARITGIVGFCNKSLKDPHTNLLRQTTEAMSLINGGVHAISVLPYDYFSKHGTSSLTTRMAINIPLILQEESYFNLVSDSLGGSYAVEHLTHLIADKAWTLFQQIEVGGGISNQQLFNQFLNQVDQKAKLRIERIKNKQDQFIGISNFLNPNEERNQWLEQADYHGLKPLIFEQA